MPTSASTPCAWPFDGDLRAADTALVSIDMPTDFCGIGGDVDKIGCDPSMTGAPIEPILRRSELGRFTHFVNLLGQAALAVPSGFCHGGPAGQADTADAAGATVAADAADAADAAQAAHAAETAEAAEADEAADAAQAAQAALPFGVTVIAPGGSDAAPVALGARWESARALPLGGDLRPANAADTALRALPASAPTLALAVVGAHPQGMPLHGQRVERGWRLLASTTTSRNCRLFALPDTLPPKPGLARVGPADTAPGVAIAVEGFEMPQSALGSFLALIPPPLGLGWVPLADGSWVSGFVCQGAGLQGALDSSDFVGWRAQLAQR